MIKGYQNLRALESATVDAIETLKKEFDESWSASNRNMANLIAGQKEAVSAMLKQEREYRISVDEENARDITRIGDGLFDFTARGFWSRLNWLLTGR